MQLQGDVVVVGVVVHPLVDHRHVAVHLLAPLLQGPVLPTLLPAPLVRPVKTTSFQGVVSNLAWRNPPKLHVFTLDIILTHLSKYSSVGSNILVLQKTLSVVIPSSHNDNEYILLPDHPPEVPVGLF